MPQILLLTFDVLPNRQLLGDDAALTVIYEQLDAVSACFDNHYLQAAGPNSLLATSAIWRRLGEVLREGGLQLCVDELCETAAAEFPLPHARCDSMPSDQILAQLAGSRSSTFDASQRTQALDGQDCEKRLRWVHTALPSADGAAAERLQSLTQAAREGDWTHVLITSLRGAPPPAEHRFSSQLFDSWLRVPLWILTDANCCRISALTGSHDVPATLLDLLSPESPESPELPVSAVSSRTGDVADPCDERTSASGDDAHREGEAVDADSSDEHAVEQTPLQFIPPVSLQANIADVGHRPERHLLIDAAGETAIRSNAFLYAAAMPPQRPALYAKPDDCWNVNDVSSDDLQLMQDYEWLLTSLKLRQLQSDA